MHSNMSSSSPLVYIFLHFFVYSSYRQYISYHGYYILSLLSRALVVSSLYYGELTIDVQPDPNC
jgi:hypothetical protein